MPIANYHLGISATHQEGEFESLPIQESVPKWLRGSLIRAGSGTFDVGKQSSHRWSDLTPLLTYTKACFY
jgi:carotenoid cleavage dioxygenase-like enzyme